MGTEFVNEPEIQIIIMVRCLKFSNTKLNILMIEKKNLIKTWKSDKFLLKHKTSHTNKRKKKPTSYKTKLNCQHKGALISDAKVAHPATASYKEVHLEKIGTMEKKEKKVHSIENLWSPPLNFFTLLTLYIPTAKLA